MATFEEYNDRLRSLGVSAPLNAIWLRAQGRCEYCGVDLLELHEVYRGADSDHLLPKSLYPLLIDKLNNYVMACASCHKLKGHRYDPGNGDARWQNVSDLTDDERKQLIDIVIARIRPLREEQKRQLLAAKDFIRLYISTT